ncbi:RelA/SpoT family protein [Oribacterium sp. WCC10]|uniref:RelA/SpoT family protein n=1 Tax=Oribacterium sp. WCC10 TaxID=1855343 RepID=UPI0008DF74EC|nr:bifunctional (p)ppGpp synthetase/guanosine-3',5'-bis(diphosphate) 3'-pyrophosphohydrolase [Oribacterium sp. WCC10]SFG54091.1 GTP pyrophosphokinase [Oribacterium sp. WCC10]
MTEEVVLERPKDNTPPEELYKSLIKTIKDYHPSDDLSMIDKAYKVATLQHKDQKRKSGEPYIIHPICVAIILADLQMDKETIVAGLLHDVVEDTGMTLQQVSDEFNPDVALLVDGVTKLTQLNLNTDKVEMQAENLRKMFVSMAKDIRVIIIKLADRLHNLRTLEYQTPEKQREKARESLEIYSPLAERLGISKIKIEMDDLSLKYLEPDVYYDLAEKVNLKKEAREERIRNIVKEVYTHITEAGIDADINGRVKHFFSIYKKMVNQNKTIDQIYDLFAIRIIVDTVRDCYASLGVIHKMYTPIPGRFKDYIAMPKPNMYQSLHTTVIGRDGIPFEIQIRTFEMHRTAEFGIAAHWKYKESGGSKESITQGEDVKMNWLHEILEWQKDESDSKEFMNMVKSDLNLFNENVYCFTPSGDVKNLPAGSCPIDFAYAIHSAVGNKMVGAKVNSKLVPVTYKLQNGDRVEVITSQNSHGPSRDWLKICKSTQAKNKINQWFKHEQKDENIDHGKELLSSYAKSRGYNLSELTKPEYIEGVIRRYSYVDWEAILASVGRGGIKESQVIAKLIELKNKTEETNLSDEDVLQNLEGMTKKPEVIRKSKSGIVVKGIHDLAVRYAKCCSPVPGDEIVGFVTRGRGITIHRTDCINMMNLPEDEKLRLIEAEWQKDHVGETYATELEIFTNNRVGLLVDISKVLSDSNIDIKALTSRVGKNDKATITVSFDIHNKTELQTLVSKIHKISGVVDIVRAQG